MNPQRIIDALWVLLIVGVIIEVVIFVQRKRQQKRDR